MDKERMDKDRMDQEFMSIIAYLYYYADMNQSDIADRLFLSRSTVSRLIKKARQNGVVELKINEPWDRDLAMEDAIKTRFSVKSARVLRVPEGITGEAVLSMLGQVATFYVSCNVHKQSILGMSWGKTIAQVNNTITTMQNIPMTVVPIMGSMMYPDTNPESLKLSQRFARIYGGRFFPLEAPLFAASREELARLLADPGIAEAMEISRKADMIVTSVGSIEDRSWDRILGMDRLTRLKEIGCVGHIGGHFFDINGNEIDGTYKELHVGLSLEEIAANDNVICVACTPRKAEAVYAALHGNLVDTLIITYPLAERLMEIVSQRSL